MKADWEERLEAQENTDIGRDVSVYEQAKTTLDKELHLLRETVGELVQRLEPVLRPADSDATDPSQSVGPAPALASEVIQHARDVTATLNSLRRRLLDVDERLEL